MFRGFTAAALAALLVTGCGTSTNTATTTSTVAPAAAMHDWRQTVIPVVGRLSDAMNWIGGAAQSLDLADMRAACRELKSSADELESKLPSPDQIVNSNIRSAVDSFGELSHVCLGLSPSSPDSEFAEVKSSREEAMDSLGRAVDRIKAVENGGAS
ncbi:hypothetical protein JVX93_21920 [Mycolicibacterium boenickei]|nr:hypothetical protein JVX93_21920 [Mycolicibacterium boenickei]